MFLDETYEKSFFQEAGKYELETKFKDLETKYNFTIKRVKEVYNDGEYDTALKYIKELNVSVNTCEMYIKQMNIGGQRVTYMSLFNFISIIGHGIITLLNFTGGMVFGFTLHILPELQRLFGAPNSADAIARDDFKLFKVKLLEKIAAIKAGYRELERSIIYKKKTDELEEKEYSKIKSESVNGDIRKDFKSLNKVFNKKLEYIRVCYTKNMYKEAFSACDELITDINATIVQVRHVDSKTLSILDGAIRSFGSNFKNSIGIMSTPDIGFFTYKRLLPNKIPFTPIKKRYVKDVEKIHKKVYKGSLNVAKELRSFIKFSDYLMEPIESLTNHANISANDLNLYRNMIIGRLKRMEIMVRGLKTFLSHSQKKYEQIINKESVKNDMETQNKDYLKQSLYDACNAGEITVEEREELLQSAYNDRYLSESLSDINEGYSNKEKFEKIKSILYERCSNGEISINQREHLIDMAYNKIFK